MDTEKPPVPCLQCGEPVYPADEYRWVTRVDEESGEGGSRGLVHERCWEAFAETHGTID
jgi:hypothetical protein